MTLQCRVSPNAVSHNEWLPMFEGKMVTMPITIAGTPAHLDGLGR